jgi:hypothetical protein
MLKDTDRMIDTSRLYRCQVLGRMTGVGNGAEGSVSVTYCGKSRPTGLRNILISQVTQLSVCEVTEVLCGVYDDESRG